MGKSTISMAIFQLALTVCLPGRVMMTWNPCAHSLWMCRSSPRGDGERWIRIGSVSPPIGPYRRNGFVLERTKLMQHTYISICMIIYIYTHIYIYIYIYICIYTRRFLDVRESSWIFLFHLWSPEARPESLRLPAVGRDQDVEQDVTSYIVSSIVAIPWIIVNPQTAV